MIEGALSRMSLMKRTNSPKRLPRLYSARKVPARMPVGVPIKVAINVITTLPKMAFNSPPALPGGGVIWLNNAGVIAPILASRALLQPQQHQFREGQHDKGDEEQDQ